MILFNDDPGSGIFEVTVSGDVTDQDIQELTAKLDQKLVRDGQLYIIEHVGEVRSLEPSQFWEDLLRTIPDDHGPGRAAIVVDDAWKVWFAELVKPFVGLEIRMFRPEDSWRARNWLKGGPPVGGIELHAAARPTRRGRRAS